MIRLHEIGGDVYINICVVPRASRTEAAGEHDGSLKVRLAAPPVDGAANAELIRFLSRAFDLARAGVEIVSGEASKRKRVRLCGVSRAAAESVLKKVLAA